MAWLIIGLILVVAIAPLTHFMPTKRQKMIANLREQAAVAGLFVSYRKMPVVPGRVADAAKDRTGVDEGTLYYGVRWLVPSKQRPAPVTWLRAEQGWQNLARRSVQVPEALTVLPESVYAFSCDAESAGIYWREEGGARDVDSIAKVLLTLRDKPEYLASAAVLSSGDDG